MRLPIIVRSIAPHALLVAALAVLPLAAFGLVIQQTRTGRAADTKMPTAEARWNDLAKAEEPSFRRHVVPLMSRTGCSGRECHGAFSGQGGFQLSLFGYDFDKDHKAINAESDNGPRVDAAHPSDSLILLKSTNEEKHKGKERIAKGSWEYNLLLKWVQGGAKNDTVETGEFDKLVVEPGEIVFAKQGDARQLRVMAHWKDGTVEDVTQLTRFRTNDESVADVSATGLVTCKEKGDTHIVAFYDNGVQPVPTMLPASEFTAAKFPKLPTRTKVDELVVNKLRKAGIVPSEICTDAEFLRRVSLDMTATLPTPEEVRAFLADRSPDKRAKKIEALLKTPGYAAWWTTLLCDYTGNNPRGLDDAGGLLRGLNGEQGRQWYEWIHKRVADNTPYDQLAAGIALGASRASAEQNYEDFAKEMAACFRTGNPADFAARETMPIFWQRRNVKKPEEKALAFAHTFLGVRIECAQCHKHPFDQWTKQDFEQFQAFFNAVTNGPHRAQAGETVSYDSVTKDINDKVAAEHGGKRSEKGDGTRYNREEATRRVRAGELVPWNEVFVDARRDGRANGKKKQEIDGSARVITPKILGGEEVVLQQYSDPRQPVVDWMRAKENPYFARAFVNRVWAAYFGRGIVEPADDMNLANPPSNKELMDFLAAGFVKSGYDMKWVHRTIANSDTYQRSWRVTPSNKLDDKNFSHARIRRLPAELVLDSIAIATESASGQARFIADMAGRAVGPDAAVGSSKKKGAETYTLKTFGRPARDMNCDCERTTDPTLLQTIFTRNDPALLASLDAVKRDGSGWIEQLRRESGAESSPEQLRDELAKLEANRQRAKVQPPEGDKDRQEKRERKIAELDQRIQRTRAELDQARQRKPVDFNRAIEEVFLRTVSRPPTPAEFAQAKQDFIAAPNPVDGVRELLWAMLNTREFMVNH